MQSNSPSELNLTLHGDGVMLVATEARRHSFDGFERGTSEIQFAVDSKRESPLTVVTKVALTLADSESGAPLFKGTSEYLVKFESEQELTGDEETSKRIAALALRVSFPFHRSTIASNVAQVGLPVYFLPLVSDEQWAGIVDEAEYEDDPAVPNE